MLIDIDKMPAEIQQTVTTIFDLVITLAAKAHLNSLGGTKLAIRGHSPVSGLERATNVFRATFERGLGEV